MAIYVQTNVSSLNAQGNLTSATNSLDVIYERLSSGLRINSAKDDAAGLQIVDRLTCQIEGLSQGNRNANDAIGLAQTMEGALDETTTMLQRIRTLAVQSANGVYTDTDREAIQQEVTQLCQEITRIACKTTYAGEQCLAGADHGIIGSSGKIVFQVGAYAYDTISISMSCGFTLSGIAMIAGLSSLLVDGTSSCFLVNNETGNFVFSVSTADLAEMTIGTIDELINAVDSKRAELGAVETRLESTISNQSNTSENVTDARSRIRDTDFAEETSNLTSQTIIQEASTTILTQANQRPQIALTLLQS